MDSSGNLYGTTDEGGANSDGTVFELASGSGTITTLASFNGTNGAIPSRRADHGQQRQSLWHDRGGGANGDGTVFELAKGSGTITTLASFNGTNGANPFAGLIMDSSGNLYGTTRGRRRQSVTAPFSRWPRQRPDHDHGSFSGSNGANPVAGLIMDSSGNLYGTTMRRRRWRRHRFRAASHCPAVRPDQRFSFLDQRRQPQTFTVTVQNADGTTDTGYTGTLHFTSTDPQAVLPADYTFTAANAGVHTFTATLETAGTQSITATDTANSLVTGSATTTVTAAAASSLTISGFPSPTTAGSAGNVTVTVLDAYGNVATGYTGTVQFTSSDPKAVLPANYTFTSADAGTHVFSATLKTAGTQSITAADTTTPGLTSTQTGITVNPAAASVLAITGPSSVTRRRPLRITVTAYDAYGNVATGYTGTLHFKSSDRGAKLPENYTFTASDQGTHIFTRLD